MLQGHAINMTHIMMRVREMEMSGQLSRNYWWHSLIHELLRTFFSTHAHISWDTSTRRWRQRRKVTHTHFFTILFTHLDTRKSRMKQGMARKSVRCQKQRKIYGTRFSIFLFRTRNSCMVLQRRISLTLFDFFCVQMSERVVSELVFRCEY